MAQDEDFIARPYQMDLYERAIAGNTIIYLPTGSGKTYVTVMVIKYLSADIRKSWNDGGKRTIFAVNTVPLVEQQRAYVSRLTDLTCNGYSGDMNVDAWDQERWTEEFVENQVLVMTAQILLDLLNHGFLSLKRINLIIFDECHHGVGDHPMRSIMKLFENYDKNDQPKVLGTSATLINANVRADRVLNTVRELENTFHAKIITVNSMDPVRGYGKPEVSIVKYALLDTTVLMQQLEKIILDATNVLGCIELRSAGIITESSKCFQPRTKGDHVKNALTDLLEHINTQGLFVASKAVLHYLIQLEKMKKSMEDTQSIIVMIYLMTELALIQKIIDLEMAKSVVNDKMYEFSCDQVRKLFAVILNYKDKLSQLTSNTKFCCIIFVRKRTTAKVIYHVLKNLAAEKNEFNFLVPEYIVGSSGEMLKNPEEAMCLSKWSAEALVKFRTGAVNCLVATDVLDEGVDIPACSLVIRYDVPPDYRAYMQSKGRARHKNSHFVLLVPTTDAVFMAKYQMFKKVEGELNEKLVGKTDERTEPAIDDLKDSIYLSEIKPYKVHDSDGVLSSVTESSAIALVNRYCSTLGTSKFVNCAPTYKLIPRDKEFQVSLRLPIISPLRDTIVGDVMSMISTAKRSAAMKVCKELHKIGELTDHLLPRNTADIIEDITKILENWREESDEDKKIIGTTGNKRSYEIVYPQALYAAFPQPDEVAYLHIIETTPTYPCPSESRNLKFYEMLNSRAGFAILSSKKMPQLPDFPIYMSAGPSNVKLQINHSEIKLSADEITQLRRFSWVVFKEVLTLIKDFMIYDKDNLENSFLIVPVNVKGNMDWDIIRNHTKIEKLVTKTYNQRAITNGEEIDISVNNNLSDWQLVSPNYRTATNMYVVTAICDDLTPKSIFPTEEYSTYIHYFADRHNLEIIDQNQPLLEVKPISTKKDCIKPRGLKSASKRKREDLEEHLIPELCYGINFPALYWLKATTLPSILHRINQLLIADDLRRQIAEEAGLGSVSAPSSSEKMEIDEYSNEETVELMMSLETTLEDNDSPNGSRSNLAPTTPDIDILSLESSRYPWSKEDEPCDLERNIETVQLIDIEYYCHFTRRIKNIDGIMNKSKYMNRQGYLARSIVNVPRLKVLEKVATSTGPSTAEIMPALTAKFANDAFNLERLETLGDSFLKFIASLYLFENYPESSEGHLTVYKGRIIGNRYLYYCGVTKNIPGRLKVDEFVAVSNFVVPSYVAPRQVREIVKSNNKSPNVLYEVIVPENEQFNGELSASTLDAFKKKILEWADVSTPTGVEHNIGLQTVPDKTVSDSVESLTGVYLESMGPIGATKLLQWFGVLPKTMDIEKVLYAPPRSAKIGSGSVDVHLRCTDFIQSVLGYEFKDKTFLLQAFTHPSYTPNTITTSYNRLEFLGDAVIDMLITVYIFENCGDLSPGALTDLRSALVNNITFACLTVRYGLHTALLAFAPILSETIDRFVKYQEERKHVVNDELLWILLEEDECNMAEYVDVPKVLGDLFESVIGAIYLDSNKDLKKVWEILYTLMHQEITSFSKNVPKQPVRVLHETPGASPRFLAYQEVTGVIMVPLEVIIKRKRKLFHGFGSTKKQAKAAAAKQALKSLRHNL